MEQIKTFLEKLQALDESAKTRLLIATTVVVMLVVIYVWLGYFNNLVAGLSQPSIAQTETTSAPVVAAAPAPAPSANQPGIWQNIGNGMANMYNAITGSRDYSIQPK